MVKYSGWCGGRGWSLGAGAIWMSRSVVIGRDVMIGDGRWRLIGTEKHIPHVPMKARANGERIDMEDVR